MKLECKPYNQTFTLCFMGYLMTFCSTKCADYVVLNDMIMNDEWERMWNEVIMA